MQFLVIIFVCRRHIMGFVSRKSASALLDDKPTGTFLLRFSESIKEGAITISWVDQSKPKGAPEFLQSPGSTQSRWTPVTPT